MTDKTYVETTGIYSVRFSVTIKRPEEISYDAWNAQVLSAVFEAQNDDAEQEWIDEDGDQAELYIELFNLNGDSPLDAEASEVKRLNAIVTETVARIKSNNQS